MRSGSALGREMHKLQKIIVYFSLLWLIETTINVPGQ